MGSWVSYNYLHGIQRIIVESVTQHFDNFSTKAPRTRNLYAYHRQEEREEIERRQKKIREGGGGDRS